MKKWSERKKWTEFIIGIILVVIFIITMFVLPPLLGWATPQEIFQRFFQPDYSTQEYLDFISTPEGLTIAIISQWIPIICVSLGIIHLIIFLIKLVQGKE